MMPCASKIMIAAFTDSMAPEVLLKDLAENQMSENALVTVIDGSLIVSTLTPILEISLYEADSQFDRFAQRFSLTMLREAKVSGLVGWFDVEMTPGVWFSTSPFEEPTHWQ